VVRSTDADELAACMAALTAGLDALGLDYTSGGI